MIRNIFILILFGMIILAYNEIWQLKSEVKKYQEITIQCSEVALELGKYGRLYE